VSRRGRKAGRALCYPPRPTWARARPRCAFRSRLRHRTPAPCEASSSGWKWLFQNQSEGVLQRGLQADVTREFRAEQSDRQKIMSGLHGELHPNLGAKAKATQAVAPAAARADGLASGEESTSAISIPPGTQARPSQVSTRPEPAGDSQLAERKTRRHGVQASGRTGKTAAEVNRS